MCQAVTEAEPIGVQINHAHWSHVPPAVCRRAIAALNEATLLRPTEWLGPTHMPALQVSTGIHRLQSVQLEFSQGATSSCSIRPSVSIMANTICPRCVLVPASSSCSCCKCHDHVPLHPCVMETDKLPALSTSRRCFTCSCSKQKPFLPARC